MRVINLDYTFNTRDIGGMKTTDGRTIAYNKLIRSGSLHKLSDKDQQTLINNNLKVVIDFRSEEEFISRADVRIDGVKYISYPLLEKDMRNDNKHADDNLLKLINNEDGGKKLLLKTYRDIFSTEKGVNGLRLFFKVIQENEDGAILWHCSQGKDRAGLAAFILEYALGVSFEDCVEDYLYTNIAMKKKIAQLTPIVLRKSKGDRSLLKGLDEVFSADFSYVETALKTIDELYGNLDYFIKNVLKIDVNLLKEKYLQ